MYLCFCMLILHYLYNFSRNTVSWFSNVSFLVVYYMFKNRINVLLTLLNMNVYILFTTLQYN